MPLVSKTSRQYGTRYNVYYPNSGNIQNNPGTGLLMSEVFDEYTNKRPLPRPLNTSSYKYTRYRTSLTWSSATRVSSGLYTAGGAALAVADYRPHLTPQPDWGSIYNRALEKLYDRVRGGLDVSVDLLEAKQTVKMLRASDQVIDIASTFVKRWGPLKAPANAWLLYTYGIKPLVGTIFGIADEQIRVAVNRVERHRVRETDQHRPQEVTLSTNDGTHSFPVSATLKASVTIGMSVLADELNDLKRWTSLNPVSIAWETLPLSFVADWFLNVGGYLRSFESALLYDSKFRGGYVSYLQAGTIPLILNQSGPGWYRNFSGSLDYLGFERSALGAPPRPTLPSFDVQLGSSRLLSAGSLLAGLLKSR